MQKKELKEHLHDDAYFIVDIREAGELQHTPLLPNVTHIPTIMLLKKATEGVLPKNKKIVTICHSGARCMFVNEQLIKNGYNADYLEGGMCGWE